MAVRERSLRWRHPEGRRITFAELHALELPEGCRKDGLDLDPELGTFAAICVVWPTELDPLRSRVRAALDSWPRATPTAKRTALRLA